MNFLANIPKSLPAYGWLIALGVFGADIGYRIYVDNFDIQGQVTVIKNRVDTLSTDLRISKERMSRAEYNIEATARMMCMDKKSRANAILAGLDCKSPYPLPNP